MEENIRIIRIANPPPADWTYIPKDVIFDRRLALMDRGLYMAICSYTDSGQKFESDDMFEKICTPGTNSAISRGEFDESVRRLIETGYILDE